MANTLTEAEISFNPFLLASKTMGVINPPSVETAIEISALVNYLILSPNHYELAAGKSLKAKEQALTTKSLTEILTPSFAFNYFLTSNNLSTLTSIDN